ncbi:MAG: tetratricopeptide repeat protein [Verrucomicrobiae bacterium]|nr:tetratricopeptide repeat protein [Verrucomicrobiae bacterium]
MKLTLAKLRDHAAGYFELKMFDDALRAAEELLKESPDDEVGLAVKTAIMWDRGRLTEAEPCLAKLAEHHPNNAGLWINLAYLRRRTRSLDAAVETLQRAFEADPKDALAHFNMACYRAVQNRPREALELLKNAIALNPKLKALARTEEDLASLRELPEFKKIV